MKRAAIAAIVMPVVVALTAAPAEALTKSRPSAPSRREVYRSYAAEHPTIRCTTLTSVRFSCHWDGFSDADVFDGQGSWAGTARVREYRVAP
jgi:hypothetical protein